MPETTGRRGLGRGLDSLLGSAAPVESTALREVEVDAIQPNPDQPRRRIDPAGLEALAASIRASGVVQPVMVRPLVDGRYELIAGERRWRAAQIAGLERIPAAVREADESARLELGLVENLAREDLNPIEIATACATLAEDFGRTHADLAERLGRSRPAISNLVRLLELPDDVQDHISSGRLTEGHGRAVLMADGARARRQVAKRALEEDLSVRQTERAASRAKAARQPKAAPRPAVVEDRALERFGAAFDAPVRVRSRQNGEIVVELRFAGEDELADALDRLP